jgi:hypothetical protein
MLLNKLPQPNKPRTPRHPALQQYTATLDAFASLRVTTALRHRVSISEIYRFLKQEDGYTGSYGAVRDYLRFRLTARQASTQNVWEQLYEEIVCGQSLQSLSFNGSPLISSTRLQRLQRDVASLREHEALCSRQARTQQDVGWINRVLRGGILAAELECQYYCDPAQSKELIARLRGSKSIRNRAMAILAHLRGVSDHTIATALGMSRLTFRRCRRIYESGGVQELFTRTARPGLKINDESLKASLFALLHEPSGNHDLDHGPPQRGSCRNRVTLHALLLSGRSPRPQDTNGAKRGLCSPRTIPTTPKNSPTSVSSCPDSDLRLSFPSTSSAPSRLRRSRGAFSPRLGRNRR